MRRLLTCLLLLVPVVASAQQSSQIDPAKSQMVDSLLSNVPVGVLNLNDLNDQLLTQVQDVAHNAHRRIPEAIPLTYQLTSGDIATITDFERQQYAAAFTVDELKEINEFLSSSAGHALLQKSTEMGSQVAAFTDDMLARKAKVIESLINNAASTAPKAQ